MSVLAVLAARAILGLVRSDEAGGRARARRRGAPRLLEDRVRRGGGALRPARGSGGAGPAMALAVEGGGARGARPPGAVPRLRFQLSMGAPPLESTYPRRRPLVAVGRTAQRHEALAVGDGREQAGDGGPVQVALPAAPYAPPVVLEAFGGGVEEPPLGGGVDCGRGSMIHAREGQGKRTALPFQKLAMSARSKGSVLMRSMLPSMPGELTTMPLGRIHDMVGVPPETPPAAAALLG